ncbi:MAG: hypothetical protein ABSG37_09305 [Candidatus Limnocylindrales bacterium]|jgi:hypothetical protein
MRFIQESGFSVRVGQAEAFQRWLAANEERIARSYPEGTEYLGTYVAVFTSEKTAGEFRILERLSSYADMDKLAAMQKDETTEYAKVMRESMQFMDTDPHADWSLVLLKGVTEASIIDIEPVA